MRISILLKREPFGKILEKTVARLLNLITKQPYKVHWFNARPNINTLRTRGQQAWLCNVYLNAIFVPEAKPEIFEPIRQEFGRSLLWWRRPAQQAYVALATSRLGARWLAQAGMGISPHLAKAEQLLIVAGNHKIRLLDRSEGVVFGVLKSGFSPHFMHREIEARRQAEKLGLSVPPLEVVAEDGTWFKERYISGTPLNRINDKDLARRTVKNISESLHRLLRKTMRDEFLKDYVEGLQTRIQQLVDTNHLLSVSDKQSLLRDTEAILQRIDTLRPYIGSYITTAMTHGDFQPANILLNQGGTWLIDWEYSARRQAGYDALVFSLNSRFPRGLATRLKSAINRKDLTQTLLMTDWPGLHWDDASWRRIHTELFLLEELLIHLEENAQPSFTRIGSGLNMLQVEIKRWLNYAE